MAIKSALRLAAEAQRLAALIAEYEASMPDQERIIPNDEQFAHPGGVLMSTKQLAKVLGLSPQTLEKWRVTGGGPVFQKIGRAVRYDWGDVEVWMAGRRVKSTAGGS